MRRKPYPKLTPKNAEIAALAYMDLMSSKCPVVRTLEIGHNTRTRGYRQTLEALRRLEDNGIIDSRTVGDAGNIWWAVERLT